MHLETPGVTEGPKDVPNNPEREAKVEELAKNILQEELNGLSRWESVFRGARLLLTLPAGVILVKAAQIMFEAVKDLQVPSVAGDVPLLESMPIHNLEVGAGYAIGTLAVMGVVGWLEGKMNKKLDEILKVFPEMDRDEDDK